MFRRQRQTGLLVSVLMFSLLGFLAVYRLVAQESRIATPNDRPPTQTDLPESGPHSKVSKEDSALKEQMDKDPVFQELKRAFSLAPSDAQSRDSTGAESIPSAKGFSKSRWLAVEKLLAAARLLESEAQQHWERQDAEASNRLQQTVQSIRSQVFELLMKP